MRFFLLLVLAGCSSGGMKISTEEVFEAPPEFDTWVGSNGEKEGWVGAGRLETKHYADGQKRQEGNILANGDKHGVWTFWHKNGEKQRVTGYWTGWEAGYSVEWYANGQKKWEGEYTFDGQPVRWTWWNADGSVNQEKSGMYLSLIQKDEEGSWYRKNEKISDLPR